MLNPIKFKADLKADFVTLFSMPFSSITDPDLRATADKTIQEQAEAWADKISSRIDSYIKTATVSVKGNANSTKVPPATVPIPLLPDTGTGTIS